MKYLLIAISCICVVGCEPSKAQELNDSQDKVNSRNIHSSSQLQSDTARMTIQEKFSLLYQSLKETRDDYDADVMKTLAFLIMALGWFITSEKSREFLRKNRAVRISSILAVTIICVIHVRASVLTYLTSKKLGFLIESLNYLDFEHYGNYAITPMMLAANLFQNVILFGVLIVVLCSLKKTASRP